MLEVRVHHPEELIVGVTRDIGLGGVFVQTERLLPHASEVWVELRLPALGEWVRLPAIVRWACAQGIGLSFTSLRAREVWALHRLFEAAPTSR